MVEAAAKTLQDLAPSNTQRHTSSGMRRPRRQVYFSGSLRHALTAASHRNL